MEISTSVLNVNKENAIQTFYNLETAGTDYFHIDVMDGEFVENNNLDIMKEYAMAIKHISNLPLDVHLMVKKVKDIIDDYSELQPSIITIHAEVDEKNTEELIEHIKNYGIKVGLAIKPETKIEEIKKYIPLIHMVLIMTVEPGSRWTKNDNGNNRESRRAK